MFAIFIFPVQDNADTSQVYESSVVEERSLAVASPGQVE